MAIADVVAGKDPPQISRGRLVHGWNVFLNGIPLVHHSFIVIGALFAAITDLPGLLGVVTGSRSVRPHVTITRNFSAIVKIVEHTKLTSQLMLIRTYLFAEHHQ